MFANVTYLTSAHNATQLATLPHLDEIAVIGRSNAGKSSLINALLNRKNLARKSRTPGRTQMANYFSVDQKFFMVDLPGYGFSAQAKSTSAHWQRLLQAYLERPTIKGFLFIMDIRRDLDEDDRLLIGYLGSRAPLNIILNKADKLSRSQVLARQMEIRSALRQMGAQFQEISVISAEKKTGLPGLRDFCKTCVGIVAAET